MGNMPDSGNIIILHPDFEKLKADVEKLRTELSTLVIERDELLYHECKNIEMAYMLSVGALEYKVYELDCTILRLKRKVELIQAKKNRQEKIIISQIEATLDAEFAEYRARFDERIAQMNRALERSKGKILSDDEIIEMKKLYRGIVKTLHPDMHPDLSDAKLQMFRNAVDSYERGDLNELRLISAMVSDSVFPNDESGGFAFFVKEEKRIADLLRNIKDQISEIKSEYPYAMKAFVQSPKEISARKSELENHLAQLSDILSAYTTRVEEMLRWE